jgi:Copper binding periplasmic protein CusF
MKSVAQEKNSNLAALLVSIVILALICLSASTRVAAQAGKTPVSKKPATGKIEHTFRGTVEKVDPSNGTYTVSGENVPGWMAAMTMNYHLEKPANVTVQVGDHITAKVYDGDFTTLHDVRIVAVKPAASNELPPISYVCPTPGEESVLEDKPGKCPQSGVPLTALRLVTVYSCLKFQSFIQEKPGICPVDKSELVPITAALYFTCKNPASVRVLEPGKCADGSPRVADYERRPHGDHNPRHGGQFFMADDSWHHLEGTWVRPNILRVYFYNDMTQPLAVDGFSAIAAKSDASGKETAAPISLKPGATDDRNTLEVAVPGAALPANFALHLKFKPQDKERVFDFTFSDYSREPGPAASTSAAAPAQPQPQTPPIGAGSNATSLPASQTSAAPAQPADTYVPPVLRPEPPLPTTTPELLAELAKRADTLAKALEQGDLGGLWYPAIGAKEVALALEENHLGELPEAQRPKMQSAVLRLTMAAWEIDAAGDLGNKEKLMPFYRDFSAAIAEIESIYGSR